MTFSDNFSGAYVGNYNVSSLIEIVPEPFYWKKQFFVLLFIKSLDTQRWQDLYLIESWQISLDYPAQICCSYINRQQCLRTIFISRPNSSANFGPISPLWKVNTSYTLVCWNVQFSTIDWAFMSGLKILQINYDNFSFRITSN